MTDRHTRGTAFLFFHVFVGSALVWLAYTYALGFFNDKNELTWLKWLLETSFITTISIWSNIGWEKSKAVASGDCTFWDAVSKFSFLPILLLITAFFGFLGMSDLVTDRHDLRTGYTALGLSLLLISFIFLAIYDRERKIQVDQDKA